MLVWVGPFLVSVMFLGWVTIQYQKLQMISAGRRRKHLPRFELEQQVLDANALNFEEEFVQVPKRSKKRSDSDQLYRQIWSKKNGVQPKAVIVYLHGLNSYCGRLARDVQVISF
jgi:hypothetical protein